jgi:hypothetical protein
MANMAITVGKYHLFERERRGRTIIIIGLRKAANVFKKPVASARTNGKP